MSELEHPPTGQLAEAVAERLSRDSLFEARQLAAVGQGDDGAFWGLWEKHRRGLLSVCLGEMHGNHAEAEDALSQAMLKARERLPLYAGRITALRPWLAQLARNVCIDIHRSQRLRLHAPQQLEAIIEAEQPGNPPGCESPERVLLSEESEAEVWRVIRGLPRSLREPLLLRCFEKISSEDVAAELGLSPDTVRKRIQLAREGLRQRLGPGVRTRPPAGLEVPKSKRGGTPEPPADFPRAPCDLEITIHTAVSRVVNVQLGCGIRREFAVFMDRRPLREDRRIQTLRTYLEDHPRSWKKRIELAEFLYRCGSWLEAVDLWQSVLARRPWLADVAVELGLVLRLLGRHEEAAAVLARGLAHARRKTAQRHLSGLLAANRGDWIEAGAAMREAAELEPDNPSHKHRLARIYIESAQSERALQIIDDLARSNPDDLAVLALGYEALRASGHIEEARRRLEHALELAPDDVVCLHRMIETYMATGFPSGVTAAQTRRRLRHALRLAPDSFLIQESLAGYHVLCGDVEKGLAFFRAFVGRHPYCRRGWHHFARLLRLAGAEREAQEATARMRTLLEKPSPPCVGACEVS
jgi:RNA polymerase sigma factor (sigma-70 family)